MAAKTKKSKVSKKKSSSSKRSSKTSKASSQSTRQSKGLLAKAKELLTGKKDDVNALSKSESKRLAALQLEMIGDRNGAGVGAVKVYDGKKVETLTVSNAEEYRQILRRIVSGELRIAL